MPHIRLLQDRDIAAIVSAFAGLGWNKPAAQYQRYLVEQDRGERVVLLAFFEDVFAGYLTVIWQSGYQPFRSASVPEIVDFNVLPIWRRRGVGSCLMDEAERRIVEQSPLAGIGVGLDADYGTAQRLYVKRGYIPDGRGLVSHGRHVSHGDSVIVDDGLALYFTKDLGS